MSTEELNLPENSNKQPLSKCSISKASDHKDNNGDESSDVSCIGEIDHNSKDSESFKSKFYKTTADILILAFIIVLAIHVNLSWAIANSTFAEGDFCHHFMEAAEFQKAMECSSNIFDSFIIAWTWPSSYPPFVYFTSYLFSLFFGSGIASLLASQSVFIVPLCVGLYYVHRPHNGILAGVASVILGLAIPNLCFFSNQYILDYPSAAFTVLSLCLLCNCQSFTKRSLTLWFGVCFAVGILCKFTTVWFVLPGVLYLVCRDFFVHKNLRKLICWQAIMAISALILTKILCAGINIYAEASMFAIYGNKYASSRCLLVLGAVLLTSCLWWIASAKPLGKLKNIDNGSDKNRNLNLEQAYINLGQCGALTFLIAYPWFANNAIIVSSRTAPLFAEAIDNIIVFLPECMGNAYHYSGLYPCLLTAIGIILAFSPWGQTRNKIFAVSILAATFFSFIVVGRATRYIIPSYAMMSVLMVSLFVRNNWGKSCACLLAGIFFFSNVLYPVLNNPDSIKTNLANKIGEISQRDAILQGKLVQFSPYAAAWQVAPFIAAPEGAPPNDVLVPLFQVEREIANSYEIMGDRPAYSLAYGLETWSAWHNYSIIPIIAENMQTWERSWFSLARILCARPDIKDHGTPSAPQAPSKYDYVVETIVPGIDHLSEPEILDLLKAELPENLQKRVLHCMNMDIYIWSAKER